MPQLTKSAFSNTVLFLEWLADRHSNEYMSLFSDTRQAAEKEALMYQTIRAMIANYRKDGRLSSQIKLSPDSSLAKNSVAFDWLVENQYFAVDGDHCTITDLAIAKLYIHFSGALKIQPVGLAGLLSD